MHSFGIEEVLPLIMIHSIPSPNSLEHKLRGMIEQFSSLVFPPVQEFLHVISWLRGSGNLESG